MNLIKNILFSTLLYLAPALHASVDLTNDFKNIYQQQKDFTPDEQRILRNYDIYFIPGIFAESLILRDFRSSVDFSLITKDYYATQLKVMKKNKIPAQRLVTSSFDVSETRQNIQKAISHAKLRGRKIIFVSHSLGGLVLLEEVIEKNVQKHIGGIIFLQSPFHGTALADLVLNPPYEMNEFVRKILPKINISEETLAFVAPYSRNKFMNENRSKVRDLIKHIPLFTLSGVAESNSSIFKPAVDILEEGCLKGINKGCITDVFFNGPYDQSDGLIPLKSSFLENADFVKLDKVDHGEIVLNLPFENYKKEYFTTTIFRLLLKKI